MNNTILSIAFSHIRVLISNPGPGRGGVSALNGGYLQNIVNKYGGDPRTLAYSNSSKFELMEYKVKAGVTTWEEGWNGAIGESTVGFTVPFILSSGKDFTAIADNKKGSRITIDHFLEDGAFTPKSLDLFLLLGFATRNGCPIFRAIVTFINVHASELRASRFRRIAELYLGLVRFGLKIDQRTLDRITTTLCVYEYKYTGASILLFEKVYDNDIEEA